MIKNLTIIFILLSGILSSGQNQEKHTGASFNADEIQERLERVATALKKYYIKNNKLPLKLNQLIPDYLKNTKDFSFEGVQSSFDDKCGICYIPRDKIPNPDKRGQADMLAFLTSESKNGGRFIIDSKFTIWFIGEGAFQAWIAGETVIK